MEMNKIEIAKMLGLTLDIQNSAREVLPREVSELLSGDPSACIKRTFLDGYMPLEFYPEDLEKLQRSSCKTVDTKYLARTIDKKIWRTAANIYINSLRESAKQNLKYGVNYEEN